MVDPKGSAAQNGRETIGELPLPLLSAADSKKKLDRYGKAHFVRNAILGINGDFGPSEVQAKIQRDENVALTIQDITRCLYRMRTQEQLEPVRNGAGGLPPIYRKGEKFK